MLKFMKKTIAVGLLVSILAFSLTGCNSVTTGKRIIRIAHGQSETHPDNLGLLAFEKYVESRLGDKYDVQIFPNELLGPSVKAIELVQTGAIDFAVCSTGNLETFDNVYQIFSIPYLFDSVEAYHKVMEDKELMSSIYKSTEAAGFESVTWFEAGTRNFYAKTPIKTPDDLKGKKIRVQQSPTNVRMMDLFGAAAAPMSFGEVYTAIQQGVIDGAENNELALTNNKHGEVAKYYSYNQHQMVPDLLIGNVKFLNSLPPEERKVFDEAAEEATKVERSQWDSQIKNAIYQAKSMGVKFIDTDIEPFKEKVLPLHKELLEKNKKLQPIYDKIQEINKQVKEEK
ncbi:2,3-diketo-L-gulonate-binding periplasmic protein YiaO precursor [Clostridium liquoris]|uniref:2,3-diketo-L-gulonate-binding periplasmic protein YiaO n=1 Tax=Clostridium liquoris TaxID=1289519 RepID=A0A2T0B469_9CLOT|nr:TRAP transporter substrate-binding protein [Clostridium liquoris]PRR78688.1 2,3-diketo-L-gulonate-binding periplasmic protein YiaO precursor [Clostridium liquoris]